MNENTTKPGCPEQGVKFDEGKARFDLIPPLVNLEIARVYTKGAVKYGDRNWEQGIRYSRLYSAAQRHLTEFCLGNRIDEIGTHHLANAIVNLQMLLHFEQCGRSEELDDLTYSRLPQRQSTTTL